jgi:sugar phosphate isomerase/epimerase
MSATPTPSPGRRIPVALQLWSVREDVQKDFAGTVAAVARMGYSGVELAGYGTLDAPRARAALDAAGLKAAGMHVSYPALRADPQAVVGEALALGARHVTCSWWPPAQLTGAASFERLGELLGEVGRTLRAFGIRFSYHNHDAEFRIVDGKPGFEWILGAAEPRDLAAEIDVYWVQHAGYSPGKILRDLGSRVPLLHLKDEKEIGGGPVDFAEVFSAADAVGAVEWYIVEQEAYSHAPLKSVGLCLEQLRAWGRA